MQLLNSIQSQLLDRLSEKFGVSVATLMQNAGKVVAEELAKRAKPSDGLILLFAGKGNNGGDAKVAAERLTQQGYSCKLIESGDDLSVCQTLLPKTGWIVDGILGTGIAGKVRDWPAAAIAFINQSKKKILSIDIPSGLSTDKGVPFGDAVKADVTVCLGGVKLGCFLHPGCEFAGEVVNREIGIPPQAYGQIPATFQSTEPSDFLSHFARRPRGSHKGNFGHLLAIAGSKGMPGAGFLSAMGGLRSSCGRVTYALPEEAYQKFSAQTAEVMVAPIPDQGKGFFTEGSIAALVKILADKDAVLLGPGLGRDLATMAFVQKIITMIQQPLLIDADGLIALANTPRLLRERKAPTLLTPHFGEMSALTGWQTEEIQTGKVQLTLDSAKLWQSHIVLKGYRSLIASPEGKLFVNPTGNPGMATAGMGDVLAGLIAGLCAQGIAADVAAIAGVYLHGLAGDLVAKQKGERGMIASDVAHAIPEAMRAISPPL